jgi:putative glycosyltransferase
MKLSIVATLYRSASYIEEFLTRSSNVARELVGDSFEIVLVNDGSPDNSLDIAVAQVARFPFLKVIDLSRNFGHHKAMMTGLAHATGEHVYLLDSDLEEEPEWLLEFWRTMHDEHADMVYGVQRQRKGSFSERMTGSLFYTVFRALTGIVQPDNIVTARVMSRRFVNALLLHQEREINIGGLWIITGFTQVKAVVSKHASSPTTYTIGQKLYHLINAVTSFSSLPLVFIFYAGLLISFSAVLYIIYIVVLRLLQPVVIDGFATLIASIWFFSGLIIFFLGIQGIYLAKIYTEVKQRPYTIIREVYGADQHGAESPNLPKSFSLGDDDAHTGPATVAADV